MKALSLIVASLVSWTGIASALIITKTVAGNAGPWDWVNGGLNTAYQYANENNLSSQSATPTVISAADGFSFSVGDSLTISYLSGGVISGIGRPSFDANGATIFGPLDNVLLGTYGPGPSYYMNPATYPILYTELVGTFANSSGQVVGTPFPIGNLRTITVPSGATRLQLGANDNLYVDNSGSWNIQITQVPEPATWSMLLMSIAALLPSCRMRRRS
jgi:hypothetical protein